MESLTSGHVPAGAVGGGGAGDGAVGGGGGSCGPPTGTAGGHPGGGGEGGGDEGGGHRLQLEGQHSETLQMDKHIMRFIKMIIILSLPVHWQMPSLELQ